MYVQTVKAVEIASDALDLSVDTSVEQYTPD